jgi:ligand-binding SRPBCC domain-containing protein
MTGTAAGGELIALCADPRHRPALLRRETTVPRPLGETFAFFSSARNLERLTPSWLRFEILTPGEIPMHEGAIIDYRIRVRGIPLKWRSRIIRWEPPHCFVDLQIKGPYRWWHHTHRFEPTDGGTRIIDEVQYLAPLHWLTHPLIIRRDLERIFEYRSEALTRLLAR